MQEISLVNKFLTEEELKALNEKVAKHEHLFDPIKSKFGFNLPMSILNGVNMKEHFPEVWEMAVEKIKPQMEAYIGHELKFMNDPKRTFRIHRYQSPKEGLMWHVDGADYTALVVLKNTLGGGTEVIPFRASKILKYLVYIMPFTYILNKVAWVINIFKPYELITDPGSMSLLKGGAAVHRTTTNKPDGERQVLAISFDEVKKPKMNVWDYLAKKLIYQ